MPFRELHCRQSSWNLAHEGDAVGAEVEDPGGQETADDQDEGTGDARCDHPQPEDDDKRDNADDHASPS